ncbi:hypothetical protein GXP74_09385 [Streptacidiphilus sp. P02-A3a]|nr:hypothetical protein GXP74_09385 [Streptacidiphilus sp. P02-A3a]
MRDTRKDRVGVVMGELAGSVYLRPVGGGREWDSRWADLEPVSEGTHAQLRARVAELNAASSGGLL